MSAENTGSKQASGRFRSGQSGNPRGKPKGSRNRVLAALDRIGEAAAEEVLHAAVRRARNGDARAVEVILSRIWPARKGRPVDLALPVITTTADLVGAIAAIVGAVGGGIISAEEGQSVAAVLEAQRRAIETAELESRIAVLEQKQGDRQ